jgi:outer membrane protein assembly factor BamB
MRPRTQLFFMPLVLAALAACGADAPLTPDPGEPSFKKAATLPPPITTGAVFLTPESAVHDRIGDVYLVSNVNRHPQILSNDGFISRLAPDGTVLELEWIRGGVGGATLHAPTGITIYGDVIYVADADAVRLFERDTGTPIGSWEVPVRTEEVPGIPGTYWVRDVLLNDVCVGPRGEVYLTGTGIDIDLSFDLAPTGADVVYAFRDGVPVPLATGPELAGPNGCVVVGANVFVATLLGNQVYRLNPAGKLFPVATLPAGGLDGIVQSGGVLYVSSVFEGMIFRMSTGGSQITTLLDGLISPADIGYDAMRDRLIIPSLFGDFVTIQPLR